MCFLYGPGVCGGNTWRAGAFLKQAPACVRGRVEARTCFAKTSLTPRVFVTWRKAQAGNYVFDFSSCDTRRVSARYNETPKKKKVKMPARVSISLFKTHCPFRGKGVFKKVLGWVLLTLTVGIFTWPETMSVVFCLDFDLFFSSLDLLPLFFFF